MAPSPGGPAARIFRRGGGQPAHQRQALDARWRAIFGALVTLPRQDLRRSVRGAATTRACRRDVRRGLGLSDPGAPISVDHAVSGRTGSSAAPNDGGGDQGQRRRPMPCSTTLPLVLNQTVSKDEQCTGCRDLRLAAWDLDESCQRRDPVRTPLFTDVGAGRPRCAAPVRVGDRVRDVQNIGRVDADKGQCADHDAWLRHRLMLPCAVRAATHSSGCLTGTESVSASRNGKSLNSFWRTGYRAGCWSSRARHRRLVYGWTCRGVRRARRAA
ncbi:hypothetical protein K875_00050 [Mycobacterium [tuberculosis] TKK-01-0051]|uniref:Uncharacterized protein n=1 Tax=Mycobacterium [tuberculosis] TKK-01-0051 TaxID=1324261 RepID=A0A051UJT8_9MYCO|nr:hypothetical protein K875_00050 [Mycobacterium [tuberculosis] TKK-01-0051]